MISLQKRLSPLWAVILVALPVLAAFAPALFNGYTNWDDDIYFTANSIITRLSPDTLWHYFSSFHQGLYKPLVLLSYSIEYHFFGFNPAVSHSINLIFHTLNCLLVFMLIKRLSGDEWTAVFGALFFGLHPLRVESVAWIAERKDMLFGFFLISSMLSYLIYKEEDKKAWYAGSIALFILAMLSKSKGIYLPFLLILFDWYKGYSPVKNLKDKIPFFAIAAAILALNLYGLSKGSEIIDPSGYSLLKKIAASSFAFLVYLRETVFPIGLSHYNPYPHGFPAEIPASYYIAIPVVTVLAAAVFMLRRNKELLLSALFFSVAIVPLLQWALFAPSITMDHFTYIPAIGLAFGFGCLVRAAAIKWEKRVLPVTAAVLVLLGGASFARCLAWKDSITLWSDAMSKYPDSFYPYYFRSQAYAVEGGYAAAILDIEKSLQLNPNYRPAYLTKCDIYMRQGAVLDGKRVLDETIAKFPSFTQAYAVKGGILFQEHKWQEAKEAYSLAIDKGGLTDVYLNRGITNMMLGDMDAALSDFNEGIKREKKVIEHAHLSRGRLLLIKGDIKGAINDFNKALKANPVFAPAYISMGQAETMLNNFPAAEADFRKAISLTPDDSTAWSGLGTMYARMDRLQDAEQAFVKALAINPGNAEALNNLSIMKGVAEPAKTSRTVTSKNKARSR